MKMSGTRLLDAPREEVWEKLNDPAVLKRCIPGCDRITGSGKGGAAGSASGGANVRLSEVDGGTELSYDVDASVKGKLAQLGSRLIDATAAKLANEFFDNFAQEVSPAPAETAQAGEAAPTAVAPGGIPAWIRWVVAAVVLGAVVYAIR